MLIEPCPNLYLSCLKRRGTNNHVFCNACVPFDFEKDYVDMIYSDTMTLSYNLELDIDDKDKFIGSSKKHLQLGETIFEFGAKAATLDSLLDKAGAPRVIDFLSLDVEGAELPVLKGLDFNKYRFKYMLVECRDIVTLTNYLKPIGYTQIEQLTNHDYLFSSNVA